MGGNINLKLTKSECLVLEKILSEQGQFVYQRLASKIQCQYFEQSDNDIVYFDKSRKVETQ